MKSRIFITIAVIFILNACENSFLPMPVVPREGATDNKISPPENFTVTHGKKRSIGLHWDEVPGAVRYNIVMADNPFNPFIQCAETTETEFNFTVPPGKTMYYRVSSVMRNGEESAQSPYVMGSSLAQPLITDITDITESNATVTWYMDNVSDKTYKANLRYTVYCLVKGGETEVAQLALDGSQLTENKARFTGLLAGKEYSYQVEAYLVYDQSNSEKSEVMDKETARRFRPGAPEKLSASHGTAKDKIDLSFELPEMVNIALNANEYELHGLYFVIFRKSGNTEYLKVCSYFGSAEEKGPNSAGVSSKSTFPGNYDFGKTVIWSDTNVVRGLEYEYLIQSYVDGTPRTISSDASKAQAAGWALAQGTVSLGTPVYTPNIDNTLYASAELPLIFNFDSKGEEYRYKVLETINPIEDGDDAGFDPDGTIKRESVYLTGEQMKNYRAKMDLAQKSTSVSPGRGLYSYQVKICLPDSDNTPVDTLTAVGDVQIIEDMHPIVVDGFWVQDGYTNKFRIRWNFYPSRKYVLLASADGINWTEVKEYNSTPSTDESVPFSVRTEVVTAAELGSNYSPDKPVYFAMQPIKKVTIGFNSIDKKGQRVYSGDCLTLGEPKSLSVDGHSYSTLTAAWDEAQKADTYRIKYKYTADGSWKTAATVGRDALSLDAYNQLKFSFKPEGNTINIAQAGETIQVQVEALNKELQAAVISETGSDEGEIITSSTVAASQLVGSAKLAPQASKAASAENIVVSWNKITGANGYYVFRRQFNMDNTAEKGVQTVAYYIPAQELSAITITGKSLWLDNDNSRVDTTDRVKAHAGFDTGSGRYQLTDTYLSDYPKNNISSNDEYNGSYSRNIPAYKDQQNEMSWGYSYRYYIVPVVERNGIPESLDSIEFTYNKDYSNANTGIASFSIKENGVAINYSGAAALEQTGFTIGFGQNVVATKGTYVSSGNVNNGIKITWSPPPLLAGVSGFSPRYTVYRRESGGASWETLKTDVNVSEYIEIPADRGIAYEYAVGITNGSLSGGSDPRATTRFINECYNQLDDKGRPKMLGFMLDMVKMESVSRNEQKAGDNFAEEVKWKSAGIKHRSGVGNKWGIDGYEVYVMNRNIDAAWHLIADIPYANIPDQIDQSVKVTNAAGLLKVLRDYKHFFKVRSYVLDGSEKVYCPDPPYDYELRYRTNRNDLETEYVKWGARQITHQEFVKAATLVITWGIHTANGARTGWTSKLSRTTYNAGSTNGASGSVTTESNSNVNRWWFDFNSYKPNLDTKANKGYNNTYSVTFLTVNTNSKSDGTADQRKRTIYIDSSASSQYPQAYGRIVGYRATVFSTRYDYGTEFFDVIGPADVPDLYTGKMKFDGPRLGGSDGDNYYGIQWNNDGYIVVKYPATAAEVQITNAQQNTPLPFQSQSVTYRQDQDEWY